MEALLKVRKATVFSSKDAASMRTIEDYNLLYPTILPVRESRLRKIDRYTRRKALGNIVYYHCQKVSIQKSMRILHKPIGDPELIRYLQDRTIWNLFVSPTLYKLHSLMKKFFVQAASGIFFLGRAGVARQALTKPNTRAPLRRRNIWLAAAIPGLYVYDRMAKVAQIEPVLYRHHSKPRFFKWRFRLTSLWYRMRRRKRKWSMFVARLCRSKFPFRRATKLYKWAFRGLFDDFHHAYPQLGVTPKSTVLPSRTYREYAKVHRGEDPLQESLSVGSTFSNELLHKQSRDTYSLTYGIAKHYRLICKRYGFGPGHLSDTHNNYPYVTDRCDGTWGNHKPFVNWGSAVQTLINFSRWVFRPPYVDPKAQKVSTANCVFPVQYTSEQCAKVPGGSTQSYGNALHPTKTQLWSFQECKTTGMLNRRNSFFS